MARNGIALTSIVVTCFVAGAALWLSDRGTTPRGAVGNTRDERRLAPSGSPPETAVGPRGERVRAIPAEHVSAEPISAEPVSVEPVSAEHSGPKPTEPNPAAGSADEGRVAAVRVIDLHADLAYALHSRKDTLASPSSPLSPSRLREGSVGTLVVSLFVGKAYDQRPEVVRQAYQSTFASLEQALGSGVARDALGPIGVIEPANRVGIVLSFEGADGFIDRPEEIEPWIRRGACLVGLVHDHTNALAGSSTDPDPERRAIGLTAEGERLAALVLRHGGVLDAAHASDAAIDDLVRISKASASPLVVSHTGLRHLCAIDRNLDDRHLLAVASTGGVVGIDLHRGHLVSRASGEATLDDVVAHLDHAVRIAGIQHVAIGSDFDGGIHPPRGVDGADVWPQLEERLSAHGWTRDAIRAVFGGNAARVLRWAREHGCGASANIESGASSPARLGGVG